MKKYFPTPTRRMLATVLALLLCGGLQAQQMSDPDFDASVPAKTYTKEHPRVLIDEAHSNFHTRTGRYRPFAELLANDGYDVQAGTAKFDEDSLKNVRVLVIANASDGGDHHVEVKPAFTEQECDAVQNWVRAGGALLLIADHAPFGAAAANLAKRFDIEMGQGYAFDAANSLNSPMTLVFSKENGLLGEHATVRGRNESETVKRVVTFAGQSLSVPRGAVALLKFSATAYESDSREQVQVALKSPDKDSMAAHARSIEGRAQGLALTFGKGRVVVMGEAAMFSAQILRQPSRPDFRFGMNAPGNEDKQFALNVMHWLSGALTSP